MNILALIKVLSIFLLIQQVISVSQPGDVVGKLSVGYQGWFAAQNDGSPVNDWVHWTHLKPGKPRSENVKFEIYPDTREYTKLYETGFAHLGNGQPAKLFSSWDDQTIDTHFKWMQQNGIDTAALQRFGGELHDPRFNKQRNGISDKLLKAAEKHGRKVYIMWDVSGWNNFHDEIKSDWTNIIKALTKQSAYAKQNGKPVVCIWGFGFTDRPDNPSQALDVIKFLKGEGAYVIGGVPTHWRTESIDSKKGFMNVYLAFDMISPWAVGRFGGVEGAKGYYKDLEEDFKLCNSKNIDYQPVLFAGFAWANMMRNNKKNEIPRLHGDFMWQQFVNLKKIGIKNSYVAMFDEYDEGTAIAKGAEDKSMIPTDQYFLTLDADGVKVSSDFYLRLVHDGNRMLKGEIPLQEQHPTKHTL